MVRFLLYPGLHFLIPAAAILWAHAQLINIFQSHSIEFLLNKCTKIASFVYPKSRPARNAVYITVACKASRLTAAEVWQVIIIVLSLAHSYLAISTQYYAPMPAGICFWSRLLYHTFTNDAAQNAKLNSKCKHTSGVVVYKHTDWQLRSYVCTAEHWRGRPWMSTE